MSKAEGLVKVCGWAGASCMLHLTQPNQDIWALAHCFHGGSLVRTGCLAWDTLAFNKSNPVLFHVPHCLRHQMIVLMSVKLFGVLFSWTNLICLTLLPTGYWSAQQLIIQAGTLSLLYCTLPCQPFTAVEASGSLVQLLILK